MLAVPGAGGRRGSLAAAAGAADAAALLAGIEHASVALVTLAFAPRRRRPAARRQRLPRPRGSRARLLTACSWASHASGPTSRPTRRRHRRAAGVGRPGRRRRRASTSTTTTSSSRAARPTSSRPWRVQRRAVGGAGQPLARRRSPSTPPATSTASTPSSAALPPTRPSSLAGAALPGRRRARPASARAARPRAALVARLADARRPPGIAGVTGRRRAGSARGVRAAALGVAGVAAAPRRCRPWGFWPLAFVGPRRCSTGSSPTGRPASRLRPRAWLVGVGAARPRRMFWMQDLTAARLRASRSPSSPAVLGGAAALCPPGRRSAGSRSRWPGCWPRRSAARGPSAACRCRSSPSGQVAGPLAPDRPGRRHAADRRGHRHRRRGAGAPPSTGAGRRGRRRRPSSAARSCVGRGAPRREPTRAGRIRGRRSCRAAARRAPAPRTPTSAVVFERHLRGQRGRARGARSDVVWPEDVVDIDGRVTDDPSRRRAGRPGPPARHDRSSSAWSRTIARTHFRNASVAFGPRR